MGGRGVGAALRRLFGGGRRSVAAQLPPEVAGDGEVAQALREWLACLSRLDATVRLSFDRKISIDVDQLAALNADENRAWNHFRTIRLMRDTSRDGGT